MNRGTRLSTRLTVCRVNATPGGNGGLTFPFSPVYKHCKGRKPSDKFDLMNAKKEKQCYETQKQDCSCSFSNPTACGIIWQPLDDLSALTEHVYLSDMQFHMALTASSNSLQHA